MTLLVLLGTWLVSLGLLLCLLPHKQFSPLEKRTLATAPQATVASLLDGSLTAGISRMCADQFPARSLFVRVKASVELMLGKGQNNGVIAAADGYLISKPHTTEQQLTAINANLSSIDRFAKAMEERRIPFVLATVPRSIDVNQNRLSKIYHAKDAEYDLAYLRQCIDGLNLPFHDLTHPIRAAARQGLPVWYRTDHHWTSLGAYYAYLSLADALGYTPHPLSAFTPSVVCTDFVGTAYAASGMSWVDGEDITLFRYEGDRNLQTEILEHGKVVKRLDGAYDLSALATQDQYNVFLGGTNAHIRVRHTHGNFPTLLLIKDSYSQSLAPFLARHYDLILIDPRTYSTQNEAVLSLVEQENVSKVLLLYGVDTLFSGHSLRVLEYGLS